MANTLTSIAPVLYSAAQEVSNEPFGVVSAINTNFDNKGVAYGDTVKIPVAPMSTLEDFTASNVTSTGANSVASAVDVTISATKKVSWHLTGEEQRSLENGGTNQEWIRQKVAQGMRALRNSAETAAAAAMNYTEKETVEATIAKALRPYRITDDFHFMQNQFLVFIAEK